MGKKSMDTDLKMLYPVFIETGIIAALLILILIANLKLPEDSQTGFEYAYVEEGPALILPPTTINEPASVSPPPLPKVPVKLPDDSPIEEAPIEFKEHTLKSKFKIPPMAEEITLKVDHEQLKTIDVLPELIGGEQAFRNSIKYPKYALANGIEGAVIFEFVVTKKGKVKNPVIITGIGGGCDEAVLNAIKVQKFTPGVKDGEVTEFKIKEIVQFIIVGTVR